MTTRITGWVTGALTLGCLAAGLWALAALPAGQSVPIHFGLNGEPNGWAPAAVGLLIIPALCALLWLCRIVLPRITPRGANLDRSAGAYDTIWAALAVVLALTQAAVISIAFGHGVNLPLALPVVLGLMFMVIGNVLPKVRWNYVVGIRTPWTLADERVWDKTHRFGGWVMVLGGAAMVLGALIPPYGPKPGLVAGVTGMISVVTVGKSYLLWRETRGSADGAA
jgi:uncharacterized membrane protein